MRGVVSALTASESDIERIKTVVAVIDSISVPGESRSFPEPAEGISMMRYHESNAFPRTVSHLTSQPKTSSQKAAVIFSYHQTIGLDKVGSNGQILEVTLPLANTLFRNGRPSTLLMNTWKRSSEAPATFTIDHASSGTCSACAINPDACSNYADTILPLHRLTEPKQIETGLGNIIRQLRGPSNRAEPASTELEERVVDYLTKNGLPQQSVAVWALVSPNYSDLELERQVQTGQGSLYRVCK